jgi:hypothetical protein
LKHPILQKNIAELILLSPDKSVCTIVQDLRSPLRNIALDNSIMLLSKGISEPARPLWRQISEDFNAKQFWNVLRTILLPKFYKDQNRYAFPLEMSFWRTDTNNYQMI